MTILRVTFLGTSAAQPTVRRGLSATAVRAHGDRLLVDCGEGTQRQMLRYGTGFGLDYVLFTHFHADHYLGITGFLRTMAMGGRTAPLALYGPGPAIRTLLPQVIHLGIEALSFPVAFNELTDGEVIDRGDYQVQAVAVEHRTVALGYVIEEPSRAGAFDVEAARRLGVPPGPLYGELQRGNTIVTPEGRTVRPDEVLGVPRRGRKVVFSGDTRPCEALVAASGGADVLVHDSTFSETERERARETFHSTALEAARVATAANVRRLVLTHLSSRYDATPHVLRDEARIEFDGIIDVAEDGMILEIPLYAEPSLA